MTSINGNPYIGGDASEFLEKEILKREALELLESLPEEVAIAVINNYLANESVNEKRVIAYKTGYRDARHKAAELSIPYDSELILHDQIMNL